MSQQPDQLSQSPYWQWETGPEQGVQDASSAGIPGDLQADGAKPPPQAGQMGAWQIPGGDALSPLAPQPPSPHQHSLRITFAVLLIVVLLVIGGSVAGFQLNRGVNHQSYSMGHVPNVAPMTRPLGTPSATSTPLASAGLTPQPTILAQDDFQRPNQTFWGTASDGSVWKEDANSAHGFSIVAGTGQVRGGLGYFNAILGPRIANEEVLLSGSVSHFDHQRANLGAVLRWMDKTHYYKATLDGASLILVKRVAAAVFQLATVPFPAESGVRYSLRFQVVGTVLLARAWPSRSPEPPTWMIAATTNGLTGGFGGLRVLLEPGVVVTITSFKERSIA